MVGYEPEVILSGRRVNDRMSVFVADKTLELISKTLKGNKNTVNVLGVAFKENCGNFCGADFHYPTPFIASFKR